MKLYELPRGSWFLVKSNQDEGLFKLDHIDGMYSLCWHNGGICHISASAEVIEMPSPEKEDTQ